MTYPQFTTRCRLDTYKPGEWVLCNDLKFLTPGGTTVTVPRGFITDLASIPRLVQLLPGFDVNGASRKPAVLHDYLYCVQLYTRSICDELFYHALLAEGVQPLTARLFYRGVRIGGWMYYDKRSEGLDVNYDFVPADYNWGDTAP